MGGTANWRVEQRPPVRLAAPVEAVLASFLKERYPKARGDRLDAEIVALSEVFTASRGSLPGSYLNQPPVRSAYLAFFHPQQMLRGMAALEEVTTRATARGLWPSRAPLRVLDLGAGLGAMSQALLSVLPAETPVELNLLDHQRSAVRDARDLTLAVSQALGRTPPKVRNVVERAESFLQSARSRGYRYDLVIVGAVLNESRGDARALLRKTLDVVAKGGLVVLVEPALPAVGRSVMELRESFLGKTTTIAPCTHAESCPLLAGVRDWCFTVRPAQLPRDVAQRARDLGHQNYEVRFALWAFTPKRDAAPFPAGRGRVITDLMQGERVVCTGDGSVRTRDLEIATRGDLAASTRE